jgi:hypothetical protein
MPSSLANSGYGAIFYTGDAASPTGYTAVLEIATINKKNFTVPAIDVTHLKSPNTTEEMIPGILKPGAVEIMGNFIGDATQLNFVTLAQAQTVFPWKITAPMQKGTKTLTSTGTAFVTDYENGPFESNKKIDFKVTMQVTGTITDTVA